MNPPRDRPGTHRWAAFPARCRDVGADGGAEHRTPALARVPTELREAGDGRVWWTTAGAIAAPVGANGPAA